MGITLRVVGSLRVLAAVQLNDQAAAEADEVDNVGVDWFLSLELKICETMGAQNVPNPVFGLGRL
jgi:hypothetical protein